MKLSEDILNRMIKRGTSSSSVRGGGGSGAAGGGGVSQGWVEDNYISKLFWNNIFEVQGQKITTVGSGTPTVEDYIFLPNELPSDTSTTTEGVTTRVQTIITKIQVKGGLWSETFISALGQGSGGGGGGGASTLADLNDVSLYNPVSGQILQYDGTHWVNADAPQTGVTSVAAGTGLTTDQTGGGAITGSGTISLSAAAQTDIGKGVTAYGWGDHAHAGYLKSVAFSELTSHPTTLAGYGITDAYTKTEADAKYMTIAAFERLFNALDSNSQKVNHPYSSGVDSIKALFGLWTEEYMSALGQGSGGGGGGGSSTLADLIDVDLTNPSNGQILKYDGTYWVNADDAASKLSVVSKTLFGNTYWTSGGVPTDVGTSASPAALSYVTNIDSLLYFDTKNGRIGIGTPSPSYTLSVNGTTLLSGNSQVVGNLSATGDFSAHGAISSQFGNITLTASNTQMDNGRYVQIGQIRIIYDATNNALKIENADGTAANLYATGGISALGLS